MTDLTTEYASSDPTLTEILGMVKENWLNEIHTAMPGTVESFDAGTQTANIRLGFKRAYVDGAVVEYQVVPNVPVRFPATATAWVWLPLAKGDTVMVHFAERALYPWWAQGGAQDPQSPRKMSTMDAVAVPGLRTKGTPIVPKGALDSLEVTNGTAWIEITKDGTIKATGTKLALGNGTVELLALLDQLLTQLTTSPNMLAGPATVAQLIAGTATAQFNPAILAQLNIIKTQLETIKT